MKEKNFMKQQFSLAHLTVLGCTPPEMIHIAARAGYDFVGVRLIPMGVPGEKARPPEDKAMIRQMKTALEQTGVKLLDIELARIMTDMDPKAYVPAMEVGASLGARHVISSAWDTNRMDTHFIIERYMEICDLARPFNLTVDLEFPTFSRLTNLKEAAHVVRTANRPNGGILLDTLYLHLSRVDLAELDALPQEWFHFLHICDTRTEIPATREDLIHIARDARLYMGEGCIDFNEILARLPAVPISIELPNAERVKALGYETHARRCLETAKQYLKCA
jgi:sugar phosphate isomerase/epimerase